MPPYFERRHFAGAARECSHEGSISCAACLQSMIRVKPILIMRAVRARHGTCVFCAFIRCVGLSVNCGLCVKQ
jgi:hypothetical protein